MLIKEVAPREPVAVFEAFRERPYSFFLDSGMDPERLGRYSLIGSDPFLVFKCKGRETAVLEAGRRQRSEGDPFRLLQRLIAEYEHASAGDPRVPVAAGAFGYFAYDLARQIEALPQRALDDLALPDCYLGFYDRLVVYDHRQKKMFLTSTGLPEQGEKAAIRAAERLQELEGFVFAAAAKGVQAGCLHSRFHPERKTTGEKPQVYGHFSEDSYCKAVQQVQDYLRQGELQEIILSQRFSCRLQTEPWPLYLQLRKINPAPFAAYLHYPELDVLSSSPERFVKVCAGWVESRPIKGTRPRGKNISEDRRLRTELLQSKKDRTELAVISELVRNELLPVCRENSVAIREHYRLEEYPTVFHLVSTVCGQLAPERGLIDLLRAAFPAASISGTPKSRAMAIIEELEPVKRGIYTGSIGYLGFNGDADLNVVIRTMIIKDGTAYLQVGGGIIDGSRPDEEYRETLTKARALLQALGYGEEVKICRILPGSTGNL